MFGSVPYFNAFWVLSVAQIAHEPHQRSYRRPNSPNHINFFPYIPHIINLYLIGIPFNLSITTPLSPPIYFQAPRNTIYIYTYTYNICENVLKMPRQVLIELLYNRDNKNTTSPYGNKYVYMFVGLQSVWFCYAVGTVRHRFIRLFSE